MPTYAIGDVQGCYAALLALLERVAFDPERDRLWFVGDLVNRGPASLEVLRWAHAHAASVVTVLGNHDLHLLARIDGVVPAAPGDTLDAVLAAPDRDELAAWLAGRPLLHVEGGFALMHAGLLPAWSVATAEALAREVEAALQGPARAEFLASLRGDKRPRWREGLELDARRRVAAAAFTRLRLVDDDGQPRGGFKGPPERAPAGTRPWFRAAGRASADVTCVFGHWAALGLWIDADVIALDSGCVWGRCLTAVRLQDRAVFSVCADAPSRT